MKAEQLSLKQYYELKYEDLCNKEQIINEIEAYYDECHTAEDFLNDPLTGTLVSLPPGALPFDLEQWKNDSFARNTAYPDQLKHKTLSGLWTRSKSESSIAEILDKYNIPYRYECLLRLGPDDIYPDFTILHPRTRRIFIWEHCGMMDLPNYVQKIPERMGKYIENGYIPGSNLILTYETLDQPLDPGLVEILIKHYFL